MKSNLRGMARPALALVFVAALALGAGYATGGATDRTAPQAATESPPFARGVVQSVSGNELALSTSTGPMTLRLAQGVQTEALRPSTPAQITTGDWLNGGAVAHAQTLFALVGLVVIPQSQLGEAPR
jgi:hypothetical protein